VISITCLYNVHDEEESSVPLTKLYGSPAVCMLTSSATTYVAIATIAITINATLAICKQRYEAHAIHFDETDKEQTEQNGHE
jgi:hypothetical protein